MELCLNVKWNFTVVTDCVGEYKLIKWIVCLQAITFLFCSDQSMFGFVCVFLSMFIDKTGFDVARLVLPWDSWVWCDFQGWVFCCCCFLYSFKLFCFFWFCFFLRRGCPFFYAWLICVAISDWKSEYGRWPNWGWFGQWKDLTVLVLFCADSCLLCSASLVLALCWNTTIGTKGTSGCTRDQKERKKKCWG